jgi:hypothetical protein
MSNPHNEKEGPMTRNIVRYGLLALLVCAGATMAMADAAVIAE